MPRPLDERAAHVLEMSERPASILLGKISEEDVVGALQFQIRGARVRSGPSVRAPAGKGQGAGEQAAHASVLRSGGAAGNIAREQAARGGHGLLGARQREHVVHPELLMPRGDQHSFASARDGEHGGSRGPRRLRLASVRPTAGLPSARVKRVGDPSPGSTRPTAKTGLGVSAAASPRACEYAEARTWAPARTWPCRSVTDSQSLTARKSSAAANKASAGASGRNPRATANSGSPSATAAASCRATISARRGAAAMSTFPGTSAGNA